MVITAEHLHLDNNQPLSLSLGFVLSVGILLPGLMVGLWLFWECCYEVDEEDEEENRSATPPRPMPT